MDCDLAISQLPGPLQAFVLTNIVGLPAAEDLVADLASTASDSKYTLLMPTGGIDTLASKTLADAYSILEDHVLTTVVTGGDFAEGVSYSTLGGSAVQATLQGDAVELSLEGGPPVTVTSDETMTCTGPAYTVAEVLVAGDGVEAPESEPEAAPEAAPEGDEPMGVPEEEEPEAPALAPVGDRGIAVAGEPLGGDAPEPVPPPERELPPPAPAPAPVEQCETLLDTDDEGVVLVGEAAGYSPRVLEAYPDVLDAFMDPAANVTLFSPEATQLQSLVDLLNGGSVDAPAVGDILALHATEGAFTTADLLLMDSMSIETLNGPISVSVAGGNVTLEAPGSSAMIVPVEVDSCAVDSRVLVLDGILLPAGSPVTLEQLEGGAAAPLGEDGGTRDIGESGARGCGVAGSMAAVVALACAAVMA